MARQNDMNTAVAYSGIVVTISEIIAPIAISIASGLIYLGRKLVKPSQPKPVSYTQAPAPHVAMIMVPGTFVTDAFSKR